MERRDRSRRRVYCRVSIPGDLWAHSDAVFWAEAPRDFVCHPFCRQTYRVLMTAVVRQNANNEHLRFSLDEQINASGSRPEAFFSVCSISQRCTGASKGRGLYVGGSGNIFTLIISGQIFYLRACMGRYWIDEPDIQSFSEENRAFFKRSRSNWSRR